MPGASIALSDGVGCGEHGKGLLEGLVSGAGVEPAQRIAGGLRPLGLTNAQPRRMNVMGRASIALSLSMGWGEHGTSFWKSEP